MHDLHRHGPVERGIPGKKHHAHATTPQFPLDTVLGA
jgi:hypothetical protein